MPPSPNITQAIILIRSVAGDLRRQGLERHANELEWYCDMIADYASYELSRLERDLEDCKQRLEEHTRRGLSWKSITDLSEKPTQEPPPEKASSS